MIGVLWTRKFESEIGPDDEVPEFPFCIPCIFDRKIEMLPFSEPSKGTRTSSKKSLLLLGKVSWNGEEG